MNKISAKALTIFIKNKQKREFMYNLLINKIKLNDYICHSKESSFVGYNIKGENNKIIVIENGIEKELLQNERIDGLDIIINGNNNVIKLELPLKVYSSKFEIGNDNVVIDIGSSNCLNGLFIRCCFGNGQFCKIGRGTTICGANIISDAQSGCIIGEDCMFSDEIKIWRDDGHSILDMNTKEMINKPQQYVTIGNHCWIGQGVRITKNARIGNHCILGNGCVAYKNYGEDCCIIAGNPGKVVRRGITWDRRNSYYLEKGECK